MKYVEILPIVAGVLAAAFVIYIGAVGTRGYKSLWILPAVLSFLFLSFSTLAAFQEGPMGFWPEHIRNLWGNQIWFDLLLAVSIGWFLIVPKARALKMWVPLWGVLIIATGSIGFLAMASRYLYLRDSRRDA
jgi:hypothetical protein